MYTTTGEKLTWAEYEARREKGEEIFIGDYPKEDQNNFVNFAHSHTMKETEKWLKDNDFNLDIMYTDGRPTHYDKFNGECAAIRCLDGYLWN